MLYLSNQDLAGVLDLERAIEISDDLYRQFARGTAQRMSPQIFEGASHSFRISAGEIADLGGLGLRLSVSGGIGAIAVLFDIDSGALMALMDYPFSTLRTAGLAGLVMREFSSPTSTAMAMIGTGKNAVGYCMAACKVRPIELIRIYSRDREHRQVFARRIIDETGVEVIPVEDIDAAVDGAEIVCVSTSARSPVLMADQLRSGTFVVSMGRSREVDDSVYLAADDVVVSYKPDLSSDEHHMDDDGQIIELVRSGEIDWSEVHNLGSVLESKVIPTADRERTVVFRDFQTGFGDIALALAAYHECVSRGAGTTFGV
jgi:ornithine cyclodeaminase/alanine dehydrogenase-like protein (mu-crystallin family)